MIILSSLSDSKEIVGAVEQIIGQDKNKPIYFIGHHPSMGLMTVIDGLISKGYCQNNVITNQSGGENCECGQRDCACKMLNKRLLDNLFLFNETQYPDLIKIIPQLGSAVIWVINTEHPQKEEIVQWVS